MPHFENYLSYLLKDSYSKEVHTLNLSQNTLIEHSVGIIEIKGNNDLAPLILSCGVHGNETAPIEIVSELLKEIAKEELIVGRPTLLLFGHLEAMKSHQRFIDFNMNRLFNGTHSQYPQARESKRAQELEEALETFLSPYSLRPWHLDLHTAIRPSHVARFAVFPYQENTNPSDEEKNLLQNLDIDAILLANGKANTFSAHSCDLFNAFAYTLELGKVYPFGQNPHKDFLAVAEGLRALLKGDSIFKAPFKERTKIPQNYEVIKELIKDHDDYHLHLKDDYANFTPIKKGTLLETLKEVDYLTPCECAVVFPNNDVPVGQRTGLLVAKIEE